MNKKRLLITIVGFLIAILIFVWLPITLDNQSARANIRKINPPPEVLSGRVNDISITKVLSLKDFSSTSSAVVHLCSGGTWSIPYGQIDLVEMWLKRLAPHRGCD
jgi:hypothetical protein